MYKDLTTMRKLIWLKRFKARGGGGVLMTFTGNLPATVQAVAKKIKSLIQYGKIEQNGTPTPSAPVDIVCNNGTLKMRHRSGLPSGYKLLEYIGGSGSQYVITDVYLASTDVIECEYRNSSTTGYGAVYGVFKLGESSALYGNQTYYGYDVANNKVDTDMHVDTDWHSSRHDFVNGTLTIDDTTVTFTPFEFVNSTKNAVLSRYYNNNYGYNWKGYIRKFKVIRGNEVVCDLLPAKNSSDEAGLYDLISGNFYTATGGTLLEGNVVDDYELIIDGTPEVLTVGGNLLSRDGETTGKIITSDGTVSDNSTYCISAPFVLPAGNYTCTWQTGSGSRPFSVFAVDESGTPQPDGKLFYQQSATAGINTGEFAVEAETLVVASYRRNVTDLAIYGTSQTASVQSLYQVGDYADTQDIIAGAITRRVGVKVLTGNEEWTAKDQYNRVSVVANDMSNPTSPRLMPAICTHYENLHNGEAISTVTAGQFYTAAPRRLYFHISEASTEEFTAFLADQYASGTPVIVLYPLAEETTETVTGQSLRTEEGSNTVSATAEVSPIEISMEYYGEG